MSTITDLSRWNRAGLRRFLYIDGNAPLYLEQLREKFAEHFPQRWSALPPPISAEDEQGLSREQLEFERNLKWVEQYQGERRDIAWELARAFARACHVLTAHLDAHANEGFLRTATQWEHIRRLVATIDYQPAPATSATTELVMLAKPGQRGVVPQGFQVKYTPPEGGDQVIFETLDELDIDHALNQLRPSGWDQSADSLAPDTDPPLAPPALLAADSAVANVITPAASTPAVVKTTWRTPRKPQVKVDQVAMVLHLSEQIREAVTIAEADLADSGDEFLYLQPSPVQFSWHQWTKNVARLLVAPRRRRDSWLNGANVIRTAVPHGLTADAYISWRRDQQWVFAKVIDADARNLRLELTGPLPEPETLLYQARPLAGPNLPADIEAIGLLDESLPDDAVIDKTAASLADYTIPQLPAIISQGPTDSENPLSLIPSIFGILPDVGSFVVPSPMLPINLVMAAVKLLLQLGIMLIPSTGKPVFKFISPEELADEIYDLVDSSQSIKWENSDPGDVKSAIKAALEEIIPEGEDLPLFKIIEQTYLQKGPFLVIPQHPPVLARVVTADPKYVFNGSPNKIDAGDWIAAQFTDGLRALRVAAVIDLSDDSDPAAFALSFDGLSGNEGELQQIHSEFRAELEAEDSRINQDAVDLQNLELDVDAIPASLKRGHRIILTAPGICEPVSATVVEINGNAIKTDAPDNPCFNKNNLIIHGNVIAAGHGAIKPVTRLSSGNASSGFQSLLLEVENVASVLDVTFPSGVRPDLEVVVENTIWTQVPRLDSSSPTDTHYAVRATEDGFLRLLFGDGVRGRRLPSGSNNVQVSYRVGAGRSGNLPAGSLIKPVHPHPFIESVSQPLASGGGEAMEAIDQMQARAPATLLALERAVSLTDFDNLATSRNDVWQARASYQPTDGGFLQQVTVVVVRAGGGELDLSFQQNLEAFLSQHALPTVSVRVVGFRSQPVQLDINVRIDSERYDPNLVLLRIRETLVAALQLERRRIGEPLYLSQIYHLVEGVTGVADSQCAFVGNPAQCLAPLGEDAVIYLSADSDDLTLDYQEYVL